MSKILHVIFRHPFSQSSLTFNPKILSRLKVLCTLRYFISFIYLSVFIARQTGIPEILKTISLQYKNFLVANGFLECLTGQGFWCHKKLTQPWRRREKAT